MPSGEELLRALAEAGSWQDLIEGMSPREIAETYGISRAAAWRAATGRTRNPKFTQTDSFRNDRAARNFERIAERRIRVGKVPVYYAGNRRPEGYRDIPAVDLEDPEAIAEAIRDGEYEEAANALSAQIMAAYGAGDDEGVYLEIADYENGLE